MNVKQIGLALVLADFSALTAYAVYHYGYVGFFEMMAANAVTLTAFADLLIALSLIVAWMWRDARTHGMSPVPYTLLTLAFGSVGPLLYLVRRLGVRHTSAPGVATAQLS